MSMRLGYFQELKGSDTILLSCEPAEVRALRASLSEAMSHNSALPIHDLAQVSARYPARLFLCPAAGSLRSSDGDFLWCLSQLEYLDVDSKLEVLESASHQYFTLSRTHAMLMVSVGEYSDQWWQQYA